MIDRLSGAFPARRTILRIAAAVVLLELAALTAWRLYDHWRTGRIELTNQGPPLTVQVLDESGERPIGAPFDVLTKWALDLPDGEYRLRVTGLGRLGRTYRFAINRGETVGHELSIDEKRLLGGEWSRGPWDDPWQREEPRPFAPMTAALELTPGKADIVEYDGQTLIRRDGLTGRPVWDTSRPSGPQGPLRDPGPWIRAISADRRLVALVDPPPDLNGEGVGDLVWAFHNHPSLLAVSGKDGWVLWNYSAAVDGPGGSRPDGPDLRKGPDMTEPTTAPGARWGNAYGEPLMTDVDRDGVPDLVVTLLFSESREEIARRRGSDSNPFYRCVIVAVSGRSGR
jgi:hypothetical protein